MTEMNEYVVSVSIVVSVHVKVKATTREAATEAALESRPSIVHLAQKNCLRAELRDRKIELVCLDIGEAMDGSTVYLGPEVIEGPEDSPEDDE